MLEEELEVEVDWEFGKVKKVDGCRIK